MGKTISILRLFSQRADNERPCLASDLEHANRVQELESRLKLLSDELALYAIRKDDDPSCGTSHLPAQR